MGSFSRYDVFYVKAFILKYTTYQQSSGINMPFAISDVGLFNLSLHLHQNREYQHNIADIFVHLLIFFIISIIP